MMLENFRIIICYTLLTIGLAARFSYTLSLPVFTVQTHVSTAAETLKLAQNLFGPDDYNVTESNDRFIVQSSDGAKAVEFDTTSGGIWAADKSELWNSGGPVADLPSDSEAIALADALVAKLGLLPAKVGPVRIASGRISQTFMSHECATGNGSGVYTQQEYPLDVSVNYDITLSVSGVEFPIVGGGGKFQVTYGMCGKLIGFQGLWRDITCETPQDIAPLEEANEHFIDAAGYLNDTLKFTSSFAFFSEPFGISQETMYPVYVFNSTSQVQGQPLPHRLQTMRGGFTPTASHPPTISHRSAAKYTRSTDDVDFEAATEWLGVPYELLLTEPNAAGFRQGITSTTPNRTIKYDRSNEDVLVSDFTTDDDTYADSVDMLFYTGHANQNGWLANESNTTTAAPTIVNYVTGGTNSANEGILRNQEELEWLLIAACGPHQHETFAPGAGNVFDRWRGIFGGLHIMFAYGSGSYDTDEEGLRFARYAVEGDTLIYSWFRMAKEAQSSGVVVTAMWTEGPGGNARNDHLPGNGYVSGENVGSSQCRWFMWSEC